MCQPAACMADEKRSKSLKVVYANFNGEYLSVLVFGLRAPLQER